MRNPLTMEAFADWLEKQPADDRYEFWCNECAIGTYLKQCGLPLSSLGKNTWRDTGGDIHNLPPRFTEVSIATPRTYGAAAKRARAIAASV